MHRFSIKYFALAIGILIGSSAWAREFYAVNQKISLTYTSLEGGTVLLVDNLQVEVRVSNDEKFCEALLGNMEFPCTADTFSSSSFSGYMGMGQASNYLIAVLQTAKLSPEYETKIKRILGNQEKNSSIWITQNKASVHQLDDMEPEAFHVILTEQTNLHKL